MCRRTQMKTSRELGLCWKVLWIVLWATLTCASGDEVTMAADESGRPKTENPPVEVMVSVSLHHSEHGTHTAFAQITATIVNVSDKLVFVRCDPRILTPLSFSWMTAAEAKPMEVLIQANHEALTGDERRYALLRSRAVSRGHQMFLRDDSHVVVATKVQVPKDAGTDLRLETAVIVEYAQVGQEQVIAGQVVTNSIVRRRDESPTVTKP